MATTPIFGFEFTTENDTEAAKSDTQNKNWLVCEAIIKRQIISRSLTAPPSSPSASNGDLYLVPPAGGSPAVSGAWAGHEDELALYYGGWIFIAAVAGPDWYVDDENAWIIWDDSVSPAMWDYRDPGLRSVNAQTGTSYTLALSDARGIVTMNNASANTVAIPTEASVNFPIGTEVRVAQIGAGATTIDADTGVTFNGVSSGAGALGAQYDGVMLVKIASDTWLGIGDIGAVA